MPLPFRERLIMRFMPAALYYEARVKDEAEWGEHELSVLGDITKPGGTAIDVGANQGIFAYALAQVADRVEAFEPNPDYADFARRMLGRRARVHTLAVSKEDGRASFVVPLGDDGKPLHLGGSLEEAADKRQRVQRFEVELRTLDSLNFPDVRIIKVDVEGSELDVLEGARQTIARDKPALIVELLTGAHADPVAVTLTIASSYGYRPLLVTAEGAQVDAIPVIRSLGSNTTWGSSIRNRNVLFLPK